MAQSVSLNFDAKQWGAIKKTFAPATDASVKAWLEALLTDRVAVSVGNDAQTDYEAARATKMTAAGF